MWWRALPAAVLVICTVTLAQGPQRLNQIKDVLCVLLLNSLQKEDLGDTRRLNVNICGNNDLPSDARRIELTTNKTDTTENIKENKENNTDAVHLEIKNKRTNIQIVPNQLQETDKNYEKIDNNGTEKYLPNNKEINCNSVMDYSRGQPTLLSMVHFIQSCLNNSKPKENYNMFSFEHASISTQHKNYLNFTQTKLYITTPSQENSEEINKNKVTLSDGNRSNDENFVNGLVGRESKPEVQILQNINDFHNKSFNSRRNSEDSLKLYSDLNAEASKDVNKDEPSYTTSKSVDKHFNILQGRQVSAVDSTEIVNETRSGNNLYYGEYKEHNYLNTNDLVNVNEPQNNNYKSGYGNILYAYNETNGNALKTGSGQFKDILRNLARIPSNNFLDGKNLEGKESKLDIIVKLHEVLNFLENTAEGVNSHDNISDTDAIVTRFIRKNQTSTTVLRQKSFEASDPAKQDLISSPTINAEFVSVPSVHYVNYLPCVTINESKLTAKKPPKVIHNDFEMNNYINYGYEGQKLKKYEINEGEIVNSNNIRNDYNFYPQNIARGKVVIYQGNEPYNKDAVSRQFTKVIPAYKKNIYLYEPLKNDIKPTSAEVVSVSSLHYVNYLYPAKPINSISGPNDYKVDLDRLILNNQFAKKNIYNLEADEHNYYQYEKVKVNVVASNRKLHQSYYFYPEISSNKPDNIKPRLPKMYFTPNMQRNGNIKDYAYGSKTEIQDSLVKNIPIISDALHTRNSNIQNVNSDNSAKLVPKISMSLTRQSERNKSLDIVTCTQKYINTTNRRMNADVKKNESVIIDKNKTIPKNVITDIAESVKAVILEDLRKELNIASSTRSTTTLGSIPTVITTTPTPKTKVTVTAEISTQKILAQDTVLEKIMRFLEQMNTTKNAFQKSDNNFQISNKNMKMYKDVEILTTETYNERMVKRQNKHYPTNRDYNFALQRHKNRVTAHKEIQRQKMYKSKDNIIGPKTFQTNELEISPLGVYVDGSVSPINQNIIVSPSRREKEGKNIDSNMNYHKPLARKAQTIQINPSLRNYYENKNPAITTNTRASVQNINSHTSDNYYYDRYESEEHKDVKYLDDKFLNKVDKNSITQLGSNKDCCEQGVSQLECCDDRVVSRRQQPLVDHVPSDDLQYGHFLQSQHKVNAMLERMLASKTKFRSVETI